MSPRETKSKHLDKYPYFLNYNDPSEIPYKRLAEQLNVHPNLLRGMIRSARSNSTIYTALRKMGYQDHQIPPWFARPDEPAVRRRAAPARPGVSAEERSGAETLPEPVVRDSTPYNVGVGQGRSAQRLSALSTRSASPAHYQLVQPVYRTRARNPILDEMYQHLRESHEMEMREILEDMKRRRVLRKPLSFSQLQFSADLNRIAHAQNDASIRDMIFWYSWFQSQRTSEPIDVEEVKSLITSTLTKVMSPEAVGGADYDWKEMIQAIGEALSDSVSSTTISEETFQKCVDIIKEGEKRDWEALSKLAEMFSGGNELRKMELERMERRNKELFNKLMRDLNRKYE